MVLKKILFLFIGLFFLISNSFSEECKQNKKIKVGFFKNDFINYQYFLYYMLDKYSLKHSVDFEIDMIGNNINEYDIIFGDYDLLLKLKKKEVKYPDTVRDFYLKNEIEIKNNLFPLDLYTFLVISKNDSEYITLDDLSEIFSPIKYTIGLSFLSKKNLVYLISNNKNNKFLDFNKNDIEYRLKLFSDIYKNSNKNIIYGTYEEVYQSFNNNENLYTLFRDGVMLDKDLNFKFFQLFPDAHYIWHEKKGLFESNIENIPYSFFGFSAYLNNFKSSGFLCYLVDEKVRLKAFKDFNIQLGPLSINEVKSIEKELHKEYVNILLNKNKNIFKPNYSLEYKNYDLFSEVFFGKKNLDTIFYKADFLNK